MGNCTANLSMGMFKVDLNNREEIIDNFNNMLSIDGDLVENEDYFRDDTLELGYCSEAERLVEESTKGKRMKTKKQFIKVMMDVWGNITGQDYYGTSEFDTIDLDDGTFIVAYATGGRDDWD
jgi:hypothetical protein